MAFDGLTSEDITALSKISEKFGTGYKEAEESGNSSNHDLSERAQAFNACAGACLTYDIEGNIGYTGGTSPEVQQKIGAQYQINGGTPEKIADAPVESGFDRKEWNEDIAARFDPTKI